jgi:hypothetical protein
MCTSSPCALKVEHGGCARPRNHWLAVWQRVEMLTDGLETHAVPMHTAAIGVRRGGRVVEGAPLLREYTSKAYRGFESLPLRHLPSWKTPSYGKTSLEKRLLSNRVPISTEGTVKIQISGVGGASTVGGRKIGCSVYLSIEASYFMSVPTPLRGKTIFGQVKFFERGTLLTGGDMDKRIASVVEQWADELSVLWLKGRQK